VIDWRRSADSICNLVRALVPPWPGATTRAGALELVIDRVKAVEGSGEPGTVLEVGRGRIVVAAGGGAVAVLAARRDGERVPFDQLGLRPGDRFG